METFDLTRSVDEDERYVYVGPFAFTDDGEPLYLKYDKQSLTWLHIESFDQDCVAAGQEPLSLYHKTQAYIPYKAFLKLTSHSYH